MEEHADSQTYRATAYSKVNMTADAFFQQWAST